MQNDLLQKLRRVQPDVFLPFFHLTQYQVNDTQATLNDGTAGQSRPCVAIGRIAFGKLLDQSDF